MGKILYQNKECSHANCRSTCHVKSYAKEKVPLKRTALKRGTFKSKEGGDDLTAWFLEKRSQMVGVCANCGNKSCKDSDEYFKFSIAHLMPKAYVKSVATHPDNWIELCFWGDNSCHTRLDTGMIDLIDLNCWDSVIQKFISMYPSIAKEERRRIPQTLMQYVEVEL